MDKIFIGSNLKKLLTISPVIIDNAVFQLHYKLTTLIMFAFSITVSGYQFFGDPIMCMSRDDFGGHGNNKILNNYCWIEGTFSLAKAMKKTVGSDVPYLGVENMEAGDEVIHHAYYQWVCFVLFLQGCMFYVTRLLWKGWEGGKIKAIIFELNKPILRKDTKEEAETGIVEYFVEHNGNHSNYAFKYFTCEVLNFVNVVGQIFFLDTFLGGEFLNYGSKAISYLASEQRTGVNPLIEAFPRMTKCTFHRYGPSGDVQRHDAMCVLPLNIVNEKIFVFIWIWFVILAILSGLAVIYRALCMGWPTARSLLTRASSVLTPGKVIDKVLNRVSFGDWFVLYLLGNNIDNLHYSEIMSMLSESLDRPKSNKLEREASATPV